MNSNYEDVINAIKETINIREASLHEPNFSETDYNYLKDCIDSNFVSTVGNYVDRFSKLISQYTNSKYVIPVVNGTAALHLSLLVAGVKKGQEVILPPLTFVATANAICYNGATPHFVDVEKNTLGIDPEFLRDYLTEISTKKSGKLFNKKTGKIISAIVPVHIFGHPCRIEHLTDIAKEFNLVLIEDAAESLGSFYNDKHTGTFGLAGTISFNGNKIITTGGGGAIITNDKKFADQAMHLSTTAKIDHDWEYLHDRIGYNYRMPNLNAALGCSQFEHLDSFIIKKRKLFLKYEKNFSNIKGVQIFKEPKNARSNYWLNTLFINKEIFDKEKILKLTNLKKIKTRPSWKLLNKLEPFKNCPSSVLKVSQELEETIINLPSSPFLVD